MEESGCESKEIMMVLTARHLIESTVFACAVAVLAYLLRKRSAAARHHLWFCGVAKFAVPAVLLSHLGVACKSLLPAPLFSLILNPVFSGTFYPTSSSSVINGEPGSYHLPLLLLAGVWLGGSVTLFARWIRQSVALRQTLEASTAAERAVLADLQRRLGLRSAVALQYSPSASPEVGLWGLLHPTIRIPKGLSAQLTSVEFQAVLLHELAHVRRRDNLCGAFVHGVVCVFWFHPLLWWMERRLSTERERACDEIVVAHGAPAETYIAGILKVCRFQLNDAIAGTSPMTRSDLTNRMELIMSYSSQHPASRMPSLLIAGLGALMTVVPAGIGFLQYSALAAQPVANSPQSLLNKNERACVLNNVAYPQGTVLQMDTSIRECSNAKWVASRKPATAVAKSRVAVPCQVEPSTSPNACRCQDGSYSIGAITQSANDTFIRCDRFELGKFTTWRLAIPGERGEN